MPNSILGAAPQTAEGMDWLTFTSSVIGSIAWPLVAVLFILIFKKELTALARRIEKMSLPGGGDLMFGQALDAAALKTEKVEATIEAEVKAKAPALQAQSPSKGSHARPSDPAIFDSYLWLAEHNPHAAVLEAYREIPKALNEARIILSQPELTEQQTLSVLLTESVLSGEMHELFNHLKKMRNKAMHSQETVITASEALEYRNLCQRFAGAVRSAAELHKLLQ